MRLLTATVGQLAWLVVALTASQVRADADNEDACRRALPEADRALSEARAHNDPAAIEAARAELEARLNLADRCPVAALVYRAHVAESRCDATAAREAYDAFLQRGPADDRSANAVKARLEAVRNWQSTPVSVRAGSGTANLRALCRWRGPDDSMLSCSSTTASSLTIAHPAAASCDYVASAPGHSTLRGAISGEAPVVATLQALPAQERDATTPDLHGKPKHALTTAPRTSATSESLFALPQFWILFGAALALGGATAVLVAASDNAKLVPRTTSNTPVGVQLQTLTNP